ncbi:sulfate adenylyltransferase subunit CysD [Patescibacteria group bacterium]|nr:sulfate adenylyltransferase subunit CysD [Patescibacteria group bacterium]
MIDKTIYILREVKARFKNPAVLWSTGKDSTTMLHLIKSAFFGEVPFPVVHIDTGYKFPEIYEFRDRISKDWDLDLIIAKRDNADFHPDKVGHFNCCSELKTMALIDILKKHKFDALIMSIRRDEHYMRNLERYFSPRDEKFNWHFVRRKTKNEMSQGDAPFVAQQQPELWDLFQTEFGEDCNHVRVHPILHWSELDVWKYIKDNNIPFNPLYLSKDGFRYRSLGCMPCTKPVKSSASNIYDIIKEIETSQESERSGRSQDKEGVLRKLRALGYM